MDTNRRSEEEAATHPLVRMVHLVRLLVSTDLELAKSLHHDERHAATNKARSILERIKSSADDILDGMKAKRPNDRYRPFHTPPGGSIFKRP